MDSGDQVESERKPPSTVAIPLSQSSGLPGARVLMPIFKQVEQGLEMKLSPEPPSRSSSIIAQAKGLGRTVSKVDDRGSPIFADFSAGPGLKK